jgi:hypothetical protein
MADDKRINEMSLASLLPQQLRIRASLVSRGLLEIVANENTEDMYSWLANLPQGSTLLSLAFLDGSALPKDCRDTSVWGKRVSNMSEDEMLRELMEDRCSGLPSWRAFDEDSQRKAYSWRGYIEIEGVHPFERSVNLVGANEKKVFLSAVGILLRRSLVGIASIRIYCGGDTLLQFLAKNLEDVQTFIEETNSEFGKIVVEIRKPDGTMVKRRSGLRLELTEHRRECGSALEHVVRP